MQEKKSFRPSFSAEGMYGGALLGIRSNDLVCFYDWAECRVVRRIDVVVKVRVAGFSSFSSFSDILSF